MGALQDVDFDVQVELPHAAEDGLPDSWSTSTWKDGSSATILPRAVLNFSLFALSFGVTGDGDDRIREHHRFESGRVLLIGQRVAGPNVS